MVYVSKSWTVGTNVQLNATLEIVLHVLNMFRRLALVGNNILRRCTAILEIQLVVNRVESLLNVDIFAKKSAIQKTNALKRRKFLWNKDVASDAWRKERNVHINVKNNVIQEFHAQMQYVKQKSATIASVETDLSWSCASLSKIGSLLNVMLTAGRNKEVLDLQMHLEQLKILKRIKLASN